MASWKKRQLLRRLNSTIAPQVRNCRAKRRLFAESLEKRLLLTTITSVDPPANSFNAAASTDISATFDQDVAAATATAQNFVVHGTVSQGQLIGSATTVSAAGPVITQNPTNDFASGELVHVTATGGISTTGGAANKRVWQFRTASSGSAQFADGGTGLGNTAFQVVSLGDVDGDSDLDAVLGGSHLWLNDGSGGFTYGQYLGSALGSFGLEFGDLDGDGDLDLMAGSRVMLNDGNGMFTNTNQNLGGGSAIPGDLDGDGDLDVMTAAPYAVNRVFFNNGSGQFTDSGQTLAPSSTDALVLGDFDDDGDLDAFEVLAGVANKVWNNDGNGVFNDSGQSLGGFRAGKDADVGDVDGDGDLDVAVANVYSNHGARIYLNDGSGVFTESGQAIGAATGNLYRIRLGDLDGDGDLDVFAPQRSAPGSEIWLNDGSGNFTDSGQRLFFSGPRRIDGADIGDLDGDGDLDIMEAIWQSVGGARVWFNQNLTPNVTLSTDSPTITENPGTATITATLSATHTDPVTVELGFSGSATATADYTVSGTEIVIAVGATTGSITVTAVQDDVDDDDETVIVDITGATNAQEVGSEQVTITIIDDDEPVVPDVTLTVDPTNIPEEGGIASFTASLSEVTTVPVTVDLAVAASSTATQTTDYTLSSTQITIAPGTTSGSVTATAVQDTLNEPPETITLEISGVTGGNEAGQQAATTTIVDDDAPPTFLISALTPTSSGFTATLSADVDTSTLNLFDTETGGMGPADLVVQGASTGQITGSLVVGSSARTLSFITTDDRLAADTYTVTMRSADNGFKDTAGNLLDGDANGVAGGDFSDTFTVAASTAIELGLPDFMRGPGQTAQVPHGSAGLPLSISDGTGVRNASVTIDYDANLLSITAATVGANMPAGATADIDTSSAGRAIISFSSPTDLPAGSNTLVHLQATVPTADASAIYRDQHVLDVNNIALSNGAGAPLPAIDNDAVHVAAFMADTSGNGRINATDASQTARVAAFLDSGLLSFLTVDPLIISDVSGNGRINAADASQVAQVAALIPVPTIPPIPGGVVIAGLTAVDLGPGLAGVFTTPQLAVANPANPLVGDSPTSFNVPVSSRDQLHPAVDRAIAQLSEPGMSGEAERLWQELEVALDELLSPPLLTD